MRCLIDSEKWLPIVGHEGRYEVSSLGRVKSLAHEELVPGRHPKPFIRRRPDKILSQTKSTIYPMVTLYKDGKPHVELVHRLVGLAHLSNPNNLPEINHLDEDKYNPALNNLEWSTRKLNALHSVHKTTGSKCGTSKLTEKDVIDIAGLIENSHLTQHEIGALYGVSNHCIFRIKAGYNWSWLTGFGKEDTSICVV